MLLINIFAFDQTVIANNRVIGGDAVEAGAGSFGAKGDFSAALNDGRNRSYRRGLKRVCHGFGITEGQWFFIADFLLHVA